MSNYVAKKPFRMIEYLQQNFWTWVTPPPPFREYPQLISCTDENILKDLSKAKDSIAELLNCGKSFGAAQIAVTAWFIRNQNMLTISDFKCMLCRTNLFLVTISKPQLSDHQRVANWKSFAMQRPIFKSATFSYLHF